MRKPDPTRFTGRGKRKPDILEMKGFSASLSDQPPVEEEKEASSPARSSAELAAPATQGKASTRGEKIEREGRSAKPKESATPDNRGTTTPRNRDTTVSRYHDTVVELVRKAVKEFGKEAATHRFTLEEKKAIADIIYSYKNRGLRTSENEIARIAVNFILEDYRENGEGGILDRVLRALNE